MKKIIFSISSIVFLIFLVECAGYKPIFSATKIPFKISDHSLKGDTALGNKIYFKLKNLSNSTDNQEARGIFLLIDISKSKNSTSKNTAGKTLEYKITLNTKVKVRDFFTNDEILSHTFISSETYKTQSQYFKTVQSENKSIDNLLNKTYQDLLTKLSQNIQLK